MQSTQSLLRKLTFFYLFYVFKIRVYLTLRAQVLTQHFKCSLGSCGHWLPCWTAPRERAGVGSLQPEGQARSAGGFINKVFLEHSLAHSVTCSLWLFSCRGEEFQQIRCGQRSLKHLPLGPLQKKSADLCSGRCFFLFIFFIKALSLEAFANVLILHSSALGS